MCGRGEDHCVRFQLAIATLNTKRSRSSSRARYANHLLTTHELRPRKTALQCGNQLSDSLAQAQENGALRRLALLRLLTGGSDRLPQAAVFPFHLDKPLQDDFRAE